MKSKWIYSEAKLAEVTGLSRTDLVKLRKEKLVKGKDWRKSKKGKGGTIELTEAGADKLLDAFDLRDKVDVTKARLDATVKLGDVNVPVVTIYTPPNDKLPWDIPDPTRINALPILRVCFLPINKRTLRAKDDAEEMFWVIVPNSEVWAIGDPLRAKPSRHDGYLELVGTPPRWRSDKLYRQEFK